MCMHAMTVHVHVCVCIYVCAYMCVSEVTSFSLVYSLALPEGSICLAGSDTRGRVEILYNGRWGTICYSSWDAIDGEVVCQQLGLGNDVVDPFGYIHILIAYLLSYSD